MPPLGPAGPAPWGLRQRLALHGTVLAVCAVLAGCAPAVGTDGTGDGAPEATSETGATTTAAGEATATASDGAPEHEPTDPADATPSEPAFTPDDASAIAVAEEFVRALDITLSTGDSERLLAISATTCGSCADYAETARSSMALHETVTGGALTVRSPSEVTAREESIGAVAVEVGFTREAGERFARHGELIGAWDATTFRFHVELVATRTGWLVTGIDSRRIVETD